MPLYKYEISPKTYEAISVKARRANTTADELIDVRVREFCEACASEMRDERRNALISRIVELGLDNLDELEKAVQKVLDKQ